MMNRRAAFTLIELLIVMGILGVLVTMLVPVISGQIEAARRTSCGANLHAIGQKMVEYAHEHKGRLPTFWSTHEYWHSVGFNNNVPASSFVGDGTRPLFMLMYEPDGNNHRAVDYVSPEVFVCPSVGDAEADPLAYSKQVGFTSHNNISYSYQHQYNVQVTGLPLSLLTSSSRVIMADKNPLTAFTGVTGTSGGGANKTTFSKLMATGKSHDSMSVNHDEEGQNVLRLEGSVDWIAAVNLGPDGDGICDPSNKIVGRLTRDEVPQRANDVFLIP